MSEIDFDKKEVFNDKIQPLLDDLYDVCRMNRIPFFFTALTGMHQDETEEVSMDYERRCLHPAEYNEKIPNNEIAKHIAVSCGFDVVYQAMEDKSLPEEYLDKINGKD